MSLNIIRQKLNRFDVFIREYSVFVSFLFATLGTSSKSSRSYIFTRSTINTIVIGHVTIISMFITHWMLAIELCLQDIVLNQYSTLHIFNKVLKTCLLNNLWKCKYRIIFLTRLCTGTSLDSKYVTFVKSWSVRFKVHVTQSNDYYGMTEKLTRTIKR